MKVDDMNKFIEYAKAHTPEETAKYYDIGLAYAKHLMKPFRAEFDEYIKTHSEQECMEKYNLTKSQVTQYKRWNKVYEDKLKNIDENDIVEYKKNHTYKETIEHFDLNYNCLFRILSKHNMTRSLKPEIHNGFDIKKEFPEYAKNHTRKECAEYFSANISQIRWWCEKYNVKTQIKKRTFYENLQKLYILRKGKEALYFCRIEDIARYFDLTITRTTMVINHEDNIKGYKVEKAKITHFETFTDRRKK